MEDTVYYQNIMSFAISQNSKQIGSEYIQLEIKDLTICT